MANKKKSILIKLESEGSKYFYTTKKNPKMEGGFNNTGKLKLKKYDPFTQKHEWFIEKKIK
ncbi:MAG TPA: 50S ribosomal protein L33 [Candidatus Azosocius sp. HAIN]